MSMHIIVLNVGLLLNWLLIGAWLLLVGARLLLVGTRLLLLVSARLLLVGAWRLLLLNVHRHEFRFRIDLLVKQWLLVGWDFDILF